MAIMLRLLLWGFLFFLLALGGAAGALFLAGDRLLLELARREARGLAPTEVRIGSLRARWLSPELLIGDLEVWQPPSVRVRIRELSLRLPLEPLALYRAFREKREIPFQLKIRAPRISLSPPPPADLKPAPQAWPESFPFPGWGLVPWKGEVEVTEGEVSGPFPLKQLSLRASARAMPAGLEASGALQLSLGPAGGGAAVPMDLHFQLSGGRRALQLQSLSFRAAGLEGKASGELGLQPLAGKLKLSLGAPDLSVVRLRPEDRAALGLTGQPAGALSLQAELEVGAKQGLLGVGVLRLEGLKLPLSAPERTAFSGLLTGHHLEGLVGLQALLPFRAQLAWPIGSAAPAWKVANASVALDLTEAALRSPGVLDKRRGVPLRAEARASGDESGLSVEAFSLALQTLRLTGSAALPAPLGRALDASFRLQVPSLAGFPQLLPVLRSKAEGAGAALAEAQGSLSAEGSLRLLPSDPARSTVSLKALAVRGLRLPLSFRNETLQAQGVLAGSVTGAGRYADGDLDVSHASGSFDLGGLALSLPNGLSKSRGRRLTLALDTKGTASRLDVRSATLAADGLKASLSGTALFAPDRSARLRLQGTVSAQLEPLREYLPKNLPAQVSDGSLEAQAQLGGTWQPKGGLEKSPLTLSAQLTARLGSVTLPEAPKGPPPPAAPPRPLLPAWPLARGAKVEARGSVARVSRGSLRAAGIRFSARLDRGAFSVDASTASVLGGKAAVSGLSGSLLDPRLALRGRARADGIDLSQAAALASPSYAKLVKGALHADASFSVPAFAAGSLLEDASAEGQASIHNGYLSTAPLDSLVNEKLRSLPGVGDKARVSTGGLSAELQSGFAYSRGKITLKKLVAVTPKRDELRLDGDVGLNLDCDLSGEAHLATAPVAGAVREANSDPEGRLVVPVRFHGNLMAPHAEIAARAIQAMLERTASREAGKLKEKALEQAKTRARSELEKAAGGLLDQFKKSLGK